MEAHHQKENNGVISESTPVKTTIGTIISIIVITAFAVLGAAGLQFEISLMKNDIASIKSQMADVSRRLGDQNVYLQAVSVKTGVPLPLARVKKYPDFTEGKGEVN
jgi:hypothetical protein